MTKFTTLEMVHFLGVNGTSLDSSLFKRILRKPQTVELKRDLAMRNMRLVTFIEGWEALNKNYQVHS